MIRRAFTAAVAMVVAIVIGGGTSALAQHGTRLEGDTSIMDGAMVGILAMLAVTFAMQGAFASFFFLSPQAREAHGGHRPRD